MKYLHMNMVMAWRADLKDKQADYVGEGDCPICKQPIQSRPLFMADEYDMCYSCYYILMSHGVHPPTRAADLDKTALLKLRALIRKEQRHARQP